MNKAEKYLIDNNLSNIVLNKEEFPENTQENSKKWIYLSDVLEQYLTLNKSVGVNNSCLEQKIIDIEEEIIRLKEFTGLDQFS